MTRLIIGSANLRWATFVDKDMVGILASNANEWNFAQSFLHHPFEIAPKKAIDEEDIKGPLMVGNKDIRLSGNKMLATFHLYW